MTAVELKLQISECRILERSIVHLESEIYLLDSAFWPKTAVVSKDVIRKC